MIGRTLSHYRILEKLGAGGMGEVYRARDEKLGRDVAVKVLPPGLLGSEAARARFRKEALALSRLSHPHIATLLDFDSQDGVDFLVMELVEGKTLLEAVREGPLSEKEVVRLGSQLARGLQAAHERGVIHRDLKPGNLALTPDGLLKVLDFGLARLERLTLPEVGEKTASTDTAVGHVVGTPAYMAPEQLRGKGVDARTDVYGAGACLYELATGRRPFGGRSGVELTDAVLHEAPAAPRSVSGTVSPGLEAVILKALDKDPELRYQTAKELLVDLERLQVTASSTSGARPEPTLAEVGWRRRRRRLTLAASTAAVAGLLVAGGFWFLRPPANPRILNAHPLTGGLSPQLPTGDTSCWATDGVRIFFFGSQNGQAAFFQVPTTGGEPVELRRPPFSALDLYGYLSKESALLLGGVDSTASAPAAPGQVGEPLWVVPLLGGSTSRVGNLWAAAAAISPDEEQLALTEPNSILIVRRDGSKVRELTSLPRVTGLSGRIDWAPDGRRLRFDAVRAEGGEPWIWEVPVEGGSARPLWPGARGRWTKDGRYFVFQRWSRPEARGDLYAVREPRFRWLPLSAPVRLTVGPVSFSDVGPAPGDRRLLAWGTTNRGELLRFDAKTGRFESYLGGASAYYVSSSSDGQWLAWVSYPDGALWRSRPDGTERLRLTAPGWEAHLPRWSPDGRSLVFAGKGPTEGLLGIVRTSADASETEVLARSDTDADLWDPCWLPDGRTILYSHRSSARLGIYRLDLQTRTRSLLPGAEELRYPKCSSRGDVLAMGKSSAGVGLPYSVFLADQGTWELLGRLPLAHPNWLPDGRSFIGLNYATMRLERWSRAARRLELVADLHDLPLVTWVDSPWIGLGPDGSPLVTRNRSTRDLYTLDWDAP